MSSKILLLYMIFIFTMWNFDSRERAPSFVSKNDIISSLTCSSSELCSSLSNIVLFCSFESSILSWCSSWSSSISSSEPRIEDFGIEIFNFCGDNDWLLILFQNKKINWIEKQEIEILLWWIVMRA